MSVNQEVNSITRFFYMLGFPSGVIALMGCFSFGLGLWRGDVDLSNKKLILGGFLFALGVFLQHLPRAMGLYLMEPETYEDYNEGQGRKPRRKLRTFFNFRDFAGVLVWGFLVFLSGRHLWRLLHR